MNFIGEGLFELEKIVGLVGIRSKKFKKKILFLEMENSFCFCSISFHGFSS